MAVSKRMWLKEQERKKRERIKRARIKRNVILLAVLAVVIVIAVIIVKGCAGKKSAGDVGDTAVVTQAPEQTQTPTVTQGGSASQTDEVVGNEEFFSNAAFLGNAVASGISRYGILPEADFYSGVGITLENVYNTAARGSSTSVADELKSKKFNKIILSFGELELSWEDAVLFGDKYFEFIEKVKSYQPSANIYVIAIPPMAQSVTDIGENGKTAENIEAYNDELKSVAIDEKIYYVDSTDALAENGHLPDGVSSDGINLNKEYSVKLLNYITRKAYVPDESDMTADSSNEESTDEDSVDSDTNDEDDSAYDEESESTPVPARKSSQDDDEEKKDEEPEATVNVLKDSADSRDN